MGEIGRQGILKHLSWEHQQGEFFRSYEVAKAESNHLMETTAA